MSDRYSIDRQAVMHRSRDIPTGMRDRRQQSSSWASTMPSRDEYARSTRTNRPSPKRCGDVGNKYHQLLSVDEIADLKFKLKGLEQELGKTRRQNAKLEAEGASLQADCKMMEECINASHIISQKLTGKVHQAEQAFHNVQQDLAAQATSQENSMKKFDLMRATRDSSQGQTSKLNMHIIHTPFKKRRHGHKHHHYRKAGLAGLSFTVSPQLSIISPTQVQMILHTKTEAPITIQAAFVDTATRRPSSVVPPVAVGTGTHEFEAAVDREIVATFPQLVIKSLHPTVSDGMVEELCSFYSIHMLDEGAEECNEEEILQFEGSKVRLKGSSTFMELKDLFASDESCAICRCAPATVIVLPCRHLALCTKDMRGMRSRGMGTCPLCRTPIEAYVVVPGAT
ncbi:Zinc finger C3HC4 type (RING finger) [Carpediemonas membranifera]|uniref:Zinc finger C3HC4 type (RING finger) n=1 Tax=Carpediemonas membranifera TaxID=201153 RepID=A0A8J6B5A3_9EUKA|nr:Zinc finger C3HC4 type (RING finger) [Carpediemonas membranifera]|eukprot:KAG9395958.1 Zinc finger C3HC4 type (RING finger) [Carpediemonas membranifera]